MTRCSLCGRVEVEVLIDFGSHPIAHRYLDSRDEDEYTHPVKLGFCHACGLSQLVDPVPPEHLYTQYNWLSAWKWNPHLSELLDTVEQLPGLTKSSRILEIGSNDGSFLDELRARGFDHLVGLEPADDACAAAAERGLETIQGYFTAETGRAIVAKHGFPDLVIARHVLEHVADLPDFGAALTAVLRPGANVLIEVPDFEFNQETLDYTAPWEEHVNQFTAETLKRYLERLGVVVDGCDSVEFNGKALVARGRFADSAGDDGSPPSRRLRERAFAYRDAWPAFAASIDEYLASLNESGKRIGIYGIGRRAIILINVCGLGQYIEFAMDDQAERQGKYVPGARLPVVASAELDAGKLDICLLGVNAENEERLMAKHAAFAEAGGKFVSILPPSPRLPEFWLAGLVNAGA